MDELIKQVGSTPGCKVLPPAGQPTLRPGEMLPDDLKEFYELCGGAMLFAGSDYRLDIYPPLTFVPSNLEILGKSATGDISDLWYVIARSGPEEKLSIDLHPARLGRCYDSFWDRHGVAGSSAVVAESFTDLLGRCLAARGARWWWLEEDWPGLGDAYDDVEQ